MLVTFYSGRFSDTPTPDAINEMLGKDMAIWLRGAMIQRGFEDVSEVIPEDYGFGFWLRVEECPYWISQHEYERAGTDGNPRTRWMIGMTYDPGCLFILLLRLLLRKRPKSQYIDRITQAIHAILAADDEIDGIEWWEVDIHRSPPQATPPRKSLG